MEGRLASSQGLDSLKSSLDSLKSDLDSHKTLVNNVADSVIREIGEVKSYVDERCEKVETNLLTEFHKCASPAEARNRTISAALRAIDLEMESIDDRVKKLEGRQPQ